MVQQPPCLSLYQQTHRSRPENQPDGQVLAIPAEQMPKAQAQRLLLNTASLSVLCYEHERTDQPAIALWNSVAPESLVPATDAGDGESSALKRRAIDRWENERRSRDEQL